MENVNLMLLIGKLERDPELCHDSSGEARLSIHVITTEEWKDRTGAWHTEYDSHKVIVVGEAAVRHAGCLSRGSQVFVEGSIRPSNRQSRDGMGEQVSEVRARRLMRCGPIGAAPEPIKNTAVLEECLRTNPEKLPPI